MNNFITSTSHIPTMNPKSNGPTEPVNIVTLKWGTRYGAEYVNKLFASVSRNITLPFHFICFTDDNEGLAEGITSFPIPEMDLE